MSSSNPASAASAIFSPRRIAEFVAVSGANVFEPTDEQKLIITAPQHSPLLVVAGAGSGKTETMSQRVMWLIANGFVTPDQVLGLTFTRKAAGELSDRIRSQLHRMRDALASAPEATSPETRAAVEQVRSALLDQMSIPTVATYNSFAGTVVSEFGEIAGISSETAIIDDATAWRIAREVVYRSDDPRLYSIDIEPATLVELVLKLNRSMSEHLVAADDVHRIAVEFLALRNLPYSEAGDAEKNQPDVTEATAELEKLPLILELAQQFGIEKRRRGVVEFSDQVALALTIIAASPEVRRRLRERYPVVLLDEYQDTSVGQTTLLASLFAEHGVMAVGDPHQSIYGWRGASAANLAEYAEHFGMTEQQLTLSTSWRNASTVLNAANELVRPLTEQSTVHVPTLVARPSAPQGSVTVDFHDTILEEAQAVATWLQSKREAFFAEHGRNPTCAVIHRQRAKMRFFSTVLSEHGVPNEIVGVGGLLTSPEVTDVVSMLRCLWRVDAGSELIRLLAGPRWRIGVADLKELRSFAGWLSRRDHALKELSQEEREAQRLHELPPTEVTILEALDVLGTLSDDFGALQRITSTGRERLRDAAQVLAKLRGRVGVGLPDLVRQIEHELRLDIELVANESVHRSDGGRRARANLDAFYELLDSFIAIDDEGTLPSFLAWLDRAVAEDAVAEQTIEPNPDAVQLITVHGSKGLEWDYVVVPRLVADEFPSLAKGLKGWLAAGDLPFELRGDAASQPELRWRSLDTKLDFKRELGAFKDAMRAHLGNEERRLVYVAVTRAKEELRLTGSFWSTQTKPRAASVFLTELEAVGLLDGVPNVEAAGEKPEDGEGATLTWPSDPLGNRRARVEAAADAVRHEFGTLQRDAQGLAKSVGQYPELQLLLAERDRLLAAPTVELPERVNASSFKDFVTKPEDTLRRLRRPMPERPYRQAKIGTLFHQWVERRYGTAAGTAEFLVADDLEWNDEVPEVADAAVAETLETLQRAFEQSPWGSRAPVEIEREITVPFAGRRLVCKIDAVYQDDNGDYEIVDWKTGVVPKGEQEKELRMLQLELYRHAFAQWKQIDPETVDCALFYVADNQIIRADNRLTLEELEQRWLGVFDAKASSNH